MNPTASAMPRLRRLGRTDAAKVARVAASAFQGSAFYLRALGLDRRQLVRYWEAFFRLGLEDRDARIFALEDESGELLAAVAVGYQGFPHPAGCLRFLLGLLRAIGPGPWVRYLGFALGYVRAMHRPAADRRVEACGLWLFVRPDARQQWLGSTLVREVIAVVGREGKTLITGFVDAGDPPLLAFYRRLGFSVSAPFRFRGLPAATIALRAPGVEELGC